MANHLYSKLAATNLKRNKRVYLPYFIAASVMIATFFMVMNLIYSRSIANLEYGDSVLMIFDLCAKIMMIIIVPFMLYINSFIIKQRKKEFGLYAILGLGKGHVAKVIFLENLFLNMATLVTGILSGCLFGKLIFMIMLKTMKEAAKGTTYSLPPKAFLLTVLIFAGIYILSTLYNLFQVQLSNPVTLLKGEEKGEKKVRFVVPMTLLGLGILGFSYYKAFTTGSGIFAISIFFIAAIGVIIGTYLLFISGSVFFLRILKSNGRFYYQPKNFITIGSLFHRMRQNAAGLATICILSTMVIVTVSITSAIYLGQEDMVKKMQPNDVVISSEAGFDEAKQGDLNVLIDETAANHNTTVENKFSYDYFVTTQIFLDDTFTPFDDATSLDASNDGFVPVQIVPLADYNAVMTIPLSLSGSEVLFLTNHDMEDPTSFTVGETTYPVREVIRNSPFTKGKYADFGDQIVLVTADEAAAQSLYQEMSKAEADAPFQHITYVNLTGSDEDILAFTKDLYGDGTEGGYITAVESLADTQIRAYGIYGGLLFMGVFFSIVFLCAAVLIIYFKQVSEGFEDRRRFEILRKVGMSEKEVKATINRQIVTVFYLPLAVALIHVFVAINIINHMLTVMYLENTTLTLTCIIATGIIFALIYVIVYRLTAKAYYRIVTKAQK